MRCDFVMCALCFCADRCGVSSVGGALLVNIGLLREYVCTFKGIYVCVVFVC